MVSMFPIRFDPCCRVERILLSHTLARRLARDFLLHCANVLHYRLLPPLFFAPGLQDFKIRSIRRSIRCLQRRSARPPLVGRPSPKTPSSFRHRRRCAFPQNTKLVLESYALVHDRILSSNFPQGGQGSAQICGT